jgi:predicted nucleic acid-binding protein
VRAVLDTNVLVDYLSGDERARAEIERYASPCISRVTWMEVMVGVADEENEAATVRRFLDRFQLLELTAEVAEQAVRLRREQRLRLPDAIILASARTQQCPLVTRNTRDFRKEWPDIRVPYGPERGEA